MTNQERKWFTLFAVLFLFGVPLLYLVTKPAHAEGSTFSNILRQAGTHDVYISVSPSGGYSYSGWGPITDLTDSYVCVKANDLTCFPIDKIVSIKIAGIDSLPSGGQ